MSNVAIAAALEVRLAAIAAPLATAWENVDYTPVNSTPYQVANVLFAEPENPTFGNTFYRQVGYLQVSLRYPPNTGRAAASARAKAIRDWFYRGLSLTDSGVTTVIEKTPDIGPGANDGDRYVINVRIWFYANIGA